MALKVGKVDIKKAADVQQELDKGDKRYWTPPEGISHIRIMPPSADRDQYFARAAFHYGVGPDNRMFPCPKVGGDRRDCFLCEEGERLSRSRDEEDQEIGKSLRPTRKFLICLVDLDKPKDGFQVWTPGIKVFHDLNYYFTDPAWGDVSDPETGFDLILDKKGSGMNTTYGIRATRSPSSFLDFIKNEGKTVEAIYGDFEGLPDLDNYIEYPPNSDMEAAYNGTSSSTSTKKKRDEEDEDDEAPRRSSRRGKPEFDEDDAPKRSSRRAAKDDDDDEDEAPPRRRSRDDDDEEDEAPPRRRARDDDDEDEAPPRRRAAKDDDEEEAPVRGRATRTGSAASKLRKGLSDK